MKSSKKYLPHKLLAVLLSFSVAFTWMIPGSLAVFAAEEEGNVYEEITDAEIVSADPLMAGEGEDDPSGVIEMTGTSIGGITYYYADTAGVPEGTKYQATVRSRKGVQTYQFDLADLTRVGDTSYYYTVVTGVTPLSGTLYGYTGGEVKSYRDIYGELGVPTDESFDAVTSATKFTSHHAGDIPPVTAFGTDAEGNKAIVGAVLGREAKTVDAVDYVEASILKAAGEDLTEAQTAALEISLKSNPMSAPSGSTIAAKLGSIEYVRSKYGAGEINIYPDTGVEGYVWNEYLDSIYAATVSTAWVRYDEKEEFDDYELTVTFETKDGIISDILEYSQSGQPGNNPFIKRAVNGIKQQLRSGAVNVDAVTGATCTSAAIRDMISGCEDQNTGPDDHSDDPDDNTDSEEQKTE